MQTGFLEEHLPEWTPPSPPLEAVAAAAEAMISRGASGAASDGELAPSPWTSLGRWTPLDGDR